MKLPQNIAPVRIIILLKSLGYILAPQKGKHISLRHSGRPVSVVTFLNQNPLDARTLRGIIAEVSYHAFVPAKVLIDQL